jgi:poly-gamma-glutamate capsule biosynthesis protein CapA/YwtB (metallophosphatase superfamily)
MKLALAGDTMLGRGVAQSLITGRVEPLSREVVEVAAEADLFVLNLECCISERGERWPDPGKPFFFRAPPRAAEVLAAAGVDCVTLANNHALDYGEPALLDTFEHLCAAGIRWVGAGPHEAAARAPVTLEAPGGEALTVVACTDHPREFAAGHDRPGVAFADLLGGALGWLTEAIAGAPEGGPVLVTPHWGPNMTSEPAAYIRAAAAQLRGAGAALIAGHSAHVFHGAARGVLYDLGDFVDDYAVDRELRNDLGLLFIATVEDGVATAVEGVPLKLDFCHTRLADGVEAAWVRRRFRDACARLGTAAEESGERVSARLDG